MSRLPTTARIKSISKDATSPAADDGMSILNPLLALAP
jgi:hypothetical protein